MNVAKAFLLSGLSTLLFILPALSGGVEAGTQAMDLRVVAKGDSLWKIAARDSVYGDPWMWPLLYETNLEQIRDPNLIEPGWRLRYPMAPTDEQISRAHAFAAAFGEPMQSMTRLIVDDMPAAVPAPAKEEATASELGALAKNIFFALCALGLAVLGVIVVYFRRKMAKTEAQAPPVEAVKPEPKAEAPVAAQPVQEGPLPQPTESEAIIRELPEFQAKPEAPSEKAGTGEEHKEEEFKKAA